MYTRRILSVKIEIGTDFRNFLRVESKCLGDQCDVLFWYLQYWLYGLLCFPDTGLWNISSGRNYTGVNVTVAAIPNPEVSGT